MKKSIETDICESKNYVTVKMKEFDYPQNHPLYSMDEKNLFVRRILEMLNMLIKDKSVIDDLIKKCRGVEKGEFDFERYNQGCMEVIILYYLFIRALKCSKFKGIRYESEDIFENNKKLEYSFGFSGDNGKDDLINIEVKTMVCDPFIKESDIRIEDGITLIKPFFNDLDGWNSIIEHYPDDIVLKRSNYYTQFNRNIKKIVEKYDGRVLLPCNPINIGVIVINRATSIEEFYSYLYYKDKGIIYHIDPGACDALVIFSLDARVTSTLDNIYNKGYIQTILFSNIPKVRKYLEVLQFDNYIQIGDKVNEEIYHIGQNEYGRYKIMKRNGFLNIIPAEATEEEINRYVKSLENT